MTMHMVRHPGRQQSRELLGQGFGLRPGIVAWGTKALARAGGGNGHDPFNGRATSLVLTDFNGAGGWSAPHTIGSTELAADCLQRVSARRFPRSSLDRGRPDSLSRATWSTRRMAVHARVCSPFMPGDEMRSALGPELHHLCFSWPQVRVRYRLRLTDHARRGAGHG